jgi:hypothetical protein
MTSNIITAVVISFLTVTTWAYELICYHPQADSLVPLASMSSTIAWK